MLQLQVGIFDVSHEVPNQREPGHESTACPQPRSTDGKQCYACGGVGELHVSNQRTETNTEAT